MAAPPEVQAAFLLTALLSVTHGLLPQPPVKPPPSSPPSKKRAKRSRTIRASLEGDDTGAVTAPGAVRSFDAAEEKALRQVRLDFGGYPAGKYYTLRETSGNDAAFEQVKKDHPVLSTWADADIDATVLSLKSTPAEVLIYSPIGPFLILSAISIWRDGMAPWGIPPCREYVGVCASLFAGGS